jgi:hypothetical protein
MSSINFKTTLKTIDSINLVHLPLDKSAQLPSRGLVIVEGELNGVHFVSPLEPDGKKSHWLEVHEKLRKAAGINSGDEVTITMQSITDWPEPEIPADLSKALAADASAHEIWKDITTLARWDWIRWIRSTKNPATRQKRIMVALSKLNSGKRAACCFNRSECTVPEVSNQGKLIEVD